MNLGKLTRHYDLLSPWERLPLIMAASARGDDSERECLVVSAPKLGFRVPDYWGLAQALDQLALLHVVLQLDMAAMYWRMSLAMAEPPFFRRRKGARQPEERSWKALRMIAYRLVTQAEAWKLLAAELRIDPEGLLRPVPGYDSMRLAEEAAQCMAYSAQEALKYLRSMVKRRQSETAGDESLSHEIHVETAAEVAAFMRKYLETSLDEWK